MSAPGIETEVEGDPGAVRSAATWLRDTLGANTSTAADLAARARSTALSSWEGETAEAYRSFAGSLVSATDEHVGRIGRAADALDAYAAHLTQVQSDMAGVRNRAMVGGLQVSGTLVLQPDEVPPTTVEPGSPEEAAHQAAVARVTLFNGLAEESIGTLQTHGEWVDTQLPPAVADAEEEGAWAEFGKGLLGQWQNFLSGAGAGLAGLALTRRSADLAGQAREFRRKSRVSGDPRVRGGADTPKGRSFLDDLRGKSRFLGKLGKLMGPIGIGIDLGFGIKDGLETGDWTRAGLTTGASIAAGLGAVALIATAPVSVPAVLTVVAAGAAAAAASAGVGYVYDHWGDITEWGGDRIDDVKDVAGDVGDAVGGAAEGAWHAVTPW